LGIQIHPCARIYECERSWPQSACVAPGAAEKAQRVGVIDLLERFSRQGKPLEAGSEMRRTQAIGQLQAQWQAPASPVD